MELKSFDDAKILDLGTMMETQDNPERISQVYEYKKIILLGLQYTTVGYADLKLDLKNSWLQYVTKSDLCFKCLSLHYVVKL